MELTLNKANKLLEKISSIRSGGVGANYCKHFSLLKSNEDIIADFAKDKVAAFEKIVNNLSVVEDRYKLKQAVFAKNVECGLSEILAEIEVVKSEISTKENLLDSTSYEKFSEKEVFEKYIDERREIAKGAVDESEFSVYSSYFSEDELKKAVRALKRELNKLEDKKTALNANVKIDIEFSEFVTEELGL